MDKYTATITLNKAQYELLRKYYGKRITITANTLVGMVVSEAVKRAAKKYLAENSYAEIEAK